MRRRHTQLKLNLCIYPIFTLNHHIKYSCSRDGLLHTACHEKYEEYIRGIGILSSILESHDEDHVCILGDFNDTPGSPRFNEICDMLHEKIVMF